MNLFLARVKALVGWIARAAASGDQRVACIAFLTPPAHLAKMWQTFVMVALCMATLGHGGPLANPAALQEPAADTLPARRLPQDTEATKAEDDRSPRTNPSQEQDTLDSEMTSKKAEWKTKYPDNSMVLAVARLSAGNCDDGAGPFPDPTNCRYFTFCMPILHTYEEFKLTQHMCHDGFIFEDYGCSAGDCMNVMMDPEMEASPPSSQVPSWYTKPPTWFLEKPEWLKTPPPWFNYPPKSHAMNEKIQVEVGSGFAIERPDQIIKNVGVPNNASVDGTPFYHDDKTLRINIPIKIVQQ